MISGRCKFIKPWQEWNSEIHNDKMQIDRQGRCMTYPFSFEVYEETQTAQFSSSSDIPYYETSLSQCNCYDFQTRHLPCKHMYRLAVELGIIKIINRNKEGVLLQEVKNSANPDDHPEQIKRMASAKKIKPYSIDYDQETAIFSGSGKKPYQTTINTCTCRDYFVRRLPCKHIYCLRFDLDEYKKNSTFNDNI